MTLHTEYLGIVAVIVMVASYALEDQHPLFILSFAGACAVAAIYAFLIRSVPFMIAEGLWAFIAFRRWRRQTTIRLGRQ